MRERVQLDLDDDNEEIFVPDYNNTSKVQNERMKFVEII